jgi:hypothetical protein
MLRHGIPRGQRPVLGPLAETNIFQSGRQSLEWIIGTATIASKYTKVLMCKLRVEGQPWQANKHQRTGLFKRCIFFFPGQLIANT